MAPSGGPRDMQQEDIQHVRAMARFPDMNPDPVLQLDMDRVVVRANTAAEEVFDRESLVGVPWGALVDETDDELWDRALNGEPGVMFMAKIGRRHVRFSLAHVPGTSTIFIYGSDITALKEAQAQLSEYASSIEEVARFPDMNPGPVCRTAHDGTIILINRAAEELFGDGDLVGKCWIDVCPGVSAEFLDEVVAAGSPLTTEATLGDRDFIFHHAEGHDQIFIYGADVTELNAAQRALQQREKMATLGTLAAGVAHELNNPSAAVQRAASQLREAVARLQAANLELGQLALSADERETLSQADAQSLQFALEPLDADPLEAMDRQEAIEDWLAAHDIDEAWDVAEALAAQGYDEASLTRLRNAFSPDSFVAALAWIGATYPVYSLLDSIHVGASRLSEIVGALKEYSYLGRGAFHEIDVNQGLRNTLVILRNRLKKGVKVVRELDEDLPKIQGYGGELNQVWTNLIDNAVAAMDGDGRLRLATRRDGEHVVVEVEDNGSGISEEARSHVFDAFFSTKPQGEGTGLGLHTSYNIVVNRHRGSIDFESAPGQTCFIVRLPILVEGGST